MNRSKLLLLAAAGALLGATAVASPLDRMSGRYGRHHKSGDVQGNVYLIDDVLEIVPLDRRRAYFRVRTSFANRHSCAIHGVARIEGREMVYRPESRVMNLDGPCELRMRIVGNGIDLVDVNQTCRRATCGVRGRLRHSQSGIQVEHAPTDQLPCEIEAIAAISRSAA